MDPAAFRTVGEPGFALFEPRQQLALASHNSLSPAASAASWQSQQQNSPSEDSVGSKKSPQCSFWQIALAVIMCQQYHRTY